MDNLTVELSKFLDLCRANPRVIGALIALAVYVAHRSSKQLVKKIGSIIALLGIVIGILLIDKTGTVFHYQSPTGQMLGTGFIIYIVLKHWIGDKLIPKQNKDGESAG